MQPKKAVMKSKPGAKVNTGWQFRVPLYALFGTGYLGYTAARQWGKVSGSDR